jgi:autophagy-related protein 18
MAYPQPSKPPVQLFSQPAHTPPTTTNLPPSTGEVLIYDTATTESANLIVGHQSTVGAVNVIVAHQSTLGALNINNDGTMLATASEKGTVIRVFSVPMGEKLFHFRRGSLPAHIYCMSFNAANTLLSVSSATETVHVFRLIAQQSPFKPQDPAPEKDSSPPETPARRRGESFSSLGRERSTSPSSESGGDLLAGSPDGAASALAALGASTSSSTAQKPGQTLASMIRRTSQNVGLTLAAKVGGYLPASVTEMWEPARDFAWVRIPRGRAAAQAALQQQQASTAGGPGAAAGGPGGSPAKSVVAMSSGRPQLLVVTSEGQFLVFNVDLDKGGEGVLERQYS